MPEKHPAWKKARFFERKVLDFFRKAGRHDLPWRSRKTPQAGSRGRAAIITAYEVWVSEIMLQQTQVSRVANYYRRFLGRFPTVRHLARASWEEFLPYYQGLGYYARGRNMLKAARVVVKEYGGKFPNDRQELQKIPGIGPYTASAVLSFAYGENHLAWDTNLRRAVGRYFRGAKALAGSPEEWEPFFKAPRKKLNAALMDFGSVICAARPKCGICPIRSYCQYFKEGGRKEKKKEKKREKFPLTEARALVVLHANHQKYYSSGTSYRAFVVPPIFNSRAGIKEFFRKKHRLELSVRPPSQRGFIEGRPVIVVNAQILMGEHPFHFFLKKDLERYWKNLGLTVL